MSRLLYVARHAEALPDETGLTDRGRHQAVLLGQRLRDVSFTTIHHSPLPRAAETAGLVHQQLTVPPPLTASELAGDYVPYVPSETEMFPGAAEFLQQFTAEELAQGPHLARQALAKFTDPTAGEQHHLLITHNFLVAWLIRDALDAQPSRGTPDPQRPEPPPTRPPLDRLPAEAVPLIEIIQPLAG
ncbi:histidine phosphatase family protein [Kribbella sp. NPDC005582]|uniref:histidine phosphatase family protein n=1 Tax=Kribbella sp. NPDC005582 TaxID=3156893 RepID=UPI0033B4E76D